ncbi:SUMF1/EgtB/PvdO family nonheme iron enzyme [bacterium]|nr:SUMF1/EgtB/PvdO family nonheme iron enzyme [bacterium]
MKIMKITFMIPLIMIILISAVAADEPATFTAYQLQRYEGVNPGDRVKFVGICTVESERYGYATTICCDPGGGEWAAIYVYDGGQRLVADRSQVCEVVGLLSEYYDSTQINCTSETEFPPFARNEWGILPAPIETTTGVMPSAESLEHCIVICRNVTVMTDPDTYGNITIDDGSGEAKLLMRSIDPIPAIGYEYECLIGHDDYHFGEFKIRPRNEDDWVCSGTPTSTPTPECRHTGDVNDDGEITAGDAQLAFYIALGGYTPTFEEECAADCNGDDVVTAGDAQEIFIAVLSGEECVDPIITATPTPTITATPNEYDPGDLYSTNIIVGNERYVPSTGYGGFLQGSPYEEPCNCSNENPQFTHVLTRALAVMETEVTRQMWWDLQMEERDLPDDPTNESHGAGASNPAQCTTWYESLLFSNLLSLTSDYTRCYYVDSEFTIPLDATNYMTGPFYCDFDLNGYRLPTEGEWEYFCRAGTTGPFSCDEPAYILETCGSPYCVNNEFSKLEKFCVFCANSAGESEPVGSKFANSWNLKDMHGNVCEWCWDCYEELYPGGTQTDYTGAISGPDRLLRGGRWSSWAGHCRSAIRGYGSPYTRGYFLGFRLVRTIP